MEQATIYDYARMCRFHKDCADCPVAKSASICHLFIAEYPDKANEIILSWCEEHPVETRQDRFLKLFPNVRKDIDGVIEIAPCVIEKGERITNGEPCSVARGFDNCTECRKEYWLAEVNEHEWEQIHTR